MSASPSHSTMRSSNVADKGQQASRHFEMEIRVRQGDLLGPVTRDQMENPDVLEISGVGVTHVSIDSSRDIHLAVLQLCGSVRAPGI